MKIIIPTYRDIQWILPCYMRLHRKYWGAAVTILAEEKYIPESEDCKFEIPPQITDGTIYSGHFSDVLIWYLNQIEDDFIIIMLSDYLIINPVNKKSILQLARYMARDRNILRCQLGSGSGMSSAATHTDTLGNIKIYENGFLSTSLTPAIWNRKLLLEMLIPNCCAWNVEIKGNDKFLTNDWRSITPIPQPIDYINAIRGRIPDKMVNTPQLLGEIGDLIPPNVAIN